MKDYEKLVYKHFISSSSAEIDNGSIDHAKVVVEYLFRLAGKKGLSVKIVTDCLEKEFYDAFAGPIKEILNTNKVSIISLNEPEEGSFKEIVSSSGNGSIKIANEEYEALPNFILIGDSAYRLETNHLFKKAKASFNRKHKGQFLNSIFHDIETTLA